MMSYIFPNSKNDVISILCFNQCRDKIVSYFNSYFSESAALAPKNLHINKIRKIKNGYLLIFDMFMNTNNKSILFSRAYFTLDEQNKNLTLINIKKIKDFDLNGY